MKGKILKTVTVAGAFLAVTVNTVDYVKAAQDVISPALKEGVTQEQIAKSGGGLLVNGGAEAGLYNWYFFTGLPWKIDSSNKYGGEYSFTPGDSVTSHKGILSMWQTVDISAYSAGDTLILTGALKGSSYTAAMIGMEFFDGSNNWIARETKQTQSADWAEVTLEGIIPENAKMVNIVLYSYSEATGKNNAAFDNLNLSLKKAGTNTVVALPVPELEKEITQKPDVSSTQQNAEDAENVDTINQNINKENKQKDYSADTEEKNSAGNDNSTDKTIDTEKEPAAEQSKDEQSLEKEEINMPKAETANEPEMTTAQAESGPTIWRNASPEYEAYLQKANNYHLIPNCLSNSEMSEQITRQEFASVSLQLYETLSGRRIDNTTQVFQDSWNEEVCRATAAGLTVGYGNGKFGPNNPVDREQAAAIFTRVYKKYKIPEWSLAVDSNFPLDTWGVSRFADDHKIDDWSKDSIYFMAKQGIIGSAGGGKFFYGNEQDYVTREWALASAAKMLELLK